jgi:hypothetical protein
VWFARSLGLLLLAGVISLLIVALVPETAARTRAFVADTSARIDQAREKLFNRQ